MTGETYRHHQAIAVFRGGERW